MVDVWRCAECNKVKDLHGPHLNGKVEIRSDCWPCGMKRIFRRQTAAAEGAAQSAHPVSTPFLFTPQAGTRVVSARVNPFLNASSSPPAPSASRPPMGGSSFCPSMPPATSSTSSGLLAARTTGGARSSGSAAPSSEKVPAGVPFRGVDVYQDCTAGVSFSAWRAPVIPPEEAVGAPGGYLPTSSHSTDGALAQFAMQLVCCHRQNIVTGRHMDALWSNNVLYVIAQEPPLDVLGQMAGNGGDPRVAHESMGRLASILLSAEQQIATSRFRRMQRLFCPSEFTFAACCCYANMLHLETGADGVFDVYGPQVDPTTAVTRWGSTIQSCRYAKPCVVSEEQRVLGSQVVFRRTGWLCSSLHTTGAAIQLQIESMLSARSEGGKETCGVDVVLLPGTMKLEELPQAAALSIPAKPF